MKMYPTTPSRSALLALLTTAACSSPPAAVVDAGARDARPADAADAMPDASIDAGVPDLTVYTPRTEIDFAIEERNFEENACELHPDENCIGAAGDRVLLRFSVETPNVGEGDLFMGTPTTDNPDFQYSVCHEHFHFVGYAVYRLVDGEGTEVAQGQKQAFCLVDTGPFTDDPTISPTPKYSCGYQGIQRGWSDVYASDLPCQFIDITGVPEGTYKLVIEVNAEQEIAELDTTNNVVELDVDLGDPNLRTPTEACPEDAPDHALLTSNRECGWTEGATLECTPGEMVRVGCADACSLGTCSGDPMMRVCDSAQGDGNCSYGAALGSGNDSCLSSCPRTRHFQCPESGEVAVFTAPRVPGQEYSCTPALAEGGPSFP